MSVSEKITLFDLPGKSGLSWSFNPWKTRFVLNYKGLPYDTQWVEYPDLKPTLAPHMAPNKEGTEYTSPAVRLPDNTYMMDSRLIAAELESRYPSPPLHLGDPHLPQLESILPKFMFALVGIYIPRASERLVNEASVPYCIETREAFFGMTIDELARTKGGDGAYQAAKPHLDQIAAMLEEDESGPYFMGKTVSYADFVWAGILIFMKRCGEDVFQKIVETSEHGDVHVRLLAGLEKWSERSDR